MLKAVNLLIFGISVGLLAGFESSFWKGLIPFLSEPTLWMFPILYAAIHRSYRSGIVLCYITGFFLKPFTGMPLSMILVVILLTHGTVYFFKQRIYWNGLSYDISMASFSTILVHLAPFLLAALFDVNPPTSPSLGKALGKILVTPLFVIPLFQFFRWVDDFTQQTLSGTEEA